MPEPATEAVTEPMEAPDWRDMVTEDVRNDPSLSDFKTLNDLAGAYLNTKKMVGKSIRPPGPDASPEDHAAFQQDLLDKGLGLTKLPDDVEGRMELYKQMGLPEDPTGYNPIEGIDEAKFTRIAELAYNAGVSKEQLDAVVGSLAADDAELLMARESDRNAGIEGLRKEWGEAYDQKADRAKQMAKVSGAPPELLAQMEEGKVGAATLKWLDSLASSIGSEGQQLANDIGAVTSETKSELQAQFNEITNRLIKKDNGLPPAEVDRLNKKRLSIMERLQG